MNSGLVRYACRATVHLNPRNRDMAADSPVTIYEGAWAYCPMGARTEHLWEAIEPVSLTDLKLIEIIVRPREGAPRTREARA